MIARPLVIEDIPKLKEIWKLYFEKDFSFPEFLRFACKYIIEDEQGIITAGGVKLLAESILVTDLKRSKFTRFKALNLALKLSKTFTHEAGLDHLHAFVQDETFKSHLIRHGFNYSRGDALVYWRD